MDKTQAEQLIINTLEDGKAKDIQLIDVEGIASFTDSMVVATGTSTTHVKALGSMVDQAFKQAGEPCLGVETGPEPDWVLVDQGNTIVHIMTEKARAYYAIEKLWRIKDEQDESAFESKNQD